MDLQKEFLNYAIKEQNPIKNPIRGKSELKLRNLELTVKTLVKFLDYEVDEVTLIRVKQTFESSFKKVVEFNFQDLPTSIELLATNFESFLKKIAFVKYKDTFPEFWAGDETYKGITKSTFNELLLSTLFRKDDPAYTSNDTKPYPSPLVDYKGIKRTIYDESRKIRNNVHYAREYSNIELVTSLNVVLAAYLLAIEDNIEFLQVKLFDEYRLLANKINSDELRRIEKQYIELTGVENVEFESRLTEISDYSQLLTSIEHLDVENRNEESSESELSNIKTDLVINIVKRYKSFVLLGKPGSGKTTTIKKVFYQLAKEFLESTENKIYPILIDANTYNFENSFTKLIKNEIKIKSIEEFKSEHSLLILIDGLNELNENFRPNAIKELSYLIKNYDDVVFIVTSRKHGYKPISNLPAYELNALTEYQIKDFLLKILGDNYGNRLWDNINANKGIYQLAFNPLHLKMIIKVFQIRNGRLPTNKGLLYKIFCEIILERESRVYTTDKTTKSNILAHLAYFMRVNGIYRRINKDLVRSEIGTQLPYLNARVGINEILNELIDNEFFLDLGEELEFVHETYEEYFISLEIKRIYAIKKTLPTDYYNTKWLEALEMCSDLFVTDEDRANFFEHLFVGNKSNIQKRVTELSSIDVNCNFLIACRIAYNLKNEYPQIYSTAVRYVANYLSIWLHHKLKKIDFIEFDKLLEAVVTLSDIALFSKVFCQYDYIYYWLYNKEYDDLNKNSFIDYKESNKKFQDYFEIITKTISDFGVFYYFLEKIEIEKFWFSRSIYAGLSFIKKSIPTTQDYSQLLKAYELTGETKLISHIGSHDIDFFIKHYPKRGKPFYRYILKSAKSNPFSKSFLLGEIKNENVEFSFKEFIISELLQDFENVIEAIQIIDSFDTKIQEQFLNSVNIRKGIYSVPLKKLQNFKVFKYFSDSISSSLRELEKQSHFDFDNSICKYADEILSIKHKYGIDLTIHPDLIENDSNIIEPVDDSSLHEQEKRIIKKLGLTFLFESIANINQLGYITNLHEKTDCMEYEVFLIKQKKFSKVREFLTSDINNSNISRFCFVQSSIRLRFVKSMKLFHQFYMASFIVSVNEHKLEGFIRNDSKQAMYGNKDFYFLYENCSFMPKVGMSVCFLPAMNNSKRYQNLPFAYDIKINENNLKIGIVTEYKKTAKGVKILLEDITTRKKLVALINGNATSKFSFNEQFVGKKFNYVTINENEANLNMHPLVKLYPCVR